ncbi:MAG: NMD3-related protein, partial [Candidatus Hodarchaeales archaeon]
MRTGNISCIECGKSEDRFDYLCETCYLKSNPVIESRFRLKLSICRKCFAPSVRNVWRESPDPDLIEEEFKKAITETITFKYKIKPIKNSKIDIESLNDHYESLYDMPDAVQGVFSLSGNPDAFLPEINIEEPFKIFIRYRRCHSCASLDTVGSAVVKLQIRGADRQLTEISEISRSLFQELRENPSSETSLKDGWDLSFHNKSAGAGHNLSNILKEEYGALIIKTKETIGYDRIKSKSKTREVISIRLPPFLPGDIILKDDHPFQVMTVKGKTVKMFDFLLDEEVQWTKEVIWDQRTRLLIPKEELITFQLVTIEPHSNSLQFMNLSSFEIYEVS